MLKRIAIILLIISYLSNAVCYAGESFRFDCWPLDGFHDGQVIKPYGSTHFGVDLEAPEGSPVYAPVSGTIYWTYSGGSHGTSVGIEHENGLRMTFLHLSERTVKKGQVIESGQLIGRVGTTGTGRDSEPAHLHFGVIVNADAPVTQPEIRYADPLDYLPVALVEKPVAQPEPEPVPLPEAELNPSPELSADPSPVKSPRSVEQTLQQELAVKPVPVKNTAEVKSQNPIEKAVKVPHKVKLEEESPKTANVRKTIEHFPVNNKTTPAFSSSADKTTAELGKYAKISLLVILAISGIIHYLHNKGFCLTKQVL